MSAKSFLSLIDAARRAPAPCVIEFFSRLHVVVFRGLAYLQRAQHRPSSGGGGGEKSWVAIQSAFTGKSAYSGKNTSADSSACASPTGESGAYSVTLQQKGSAAYLTAVHVRLRQPRSFTIHRVVSEASLGWRCVSLHIRIVLWADKHLRTSCCSNQGEEPNIFNPDTDL